MDRLGERLVDGWIEKKIDRWVYSEKNRKMGSLGERLIDG